MYTVVDYFLNTGFLFCIESSYYTTTTVVSQSPTSIEASPSTNEPGEMDTVNHVSLSSQAAQ